ncbi:hypothetical protein ACN28G_16300 [Micromonospora sp. WMMA1923]
MIGTSAGRDDSVPAVAMRTDSVPAVRAYGGTTVTDQAQTVTG